MSRALLEQAHAALDTCESMTGYYHDERAVSAAMVAITAAIAQPEPIIAPAAWMTLDCIKLRPCSVTMDREDLIGLNPAHVVPLYRTAPPAPVIAQPEQQSVPMAEYKKLQALVSSQGIRLMEYESQPEQEPIAHVINDSMGIVKTSWVISPELPCGTALYAAPPAPDADEDEALRKRLASLLAGVAIALKGPEPALTRWSYADLPEIAAKVMIELEIYRQQAEFDRLDAQRWRFFLTAQDESTLEHAAIVSAADGLFPVSDLSKVMALAMKGGQP